MKPPFRGRFFIWWHASKIESLQFVIKKYTFDDHNHMQVHICSPYRPDKNLGKAYNETMQILPDDWWGCLTDYDVQLLTPDAGRILHEYANLFPEAALLTCYTNRISSLSKMQLLDGVVSDNTDYFHHYSLAEKQKRFLYGATQINADISGFLMMISKKAWREQPFPETGICLHVDTTYGRTIRAAGKKILRMNGLYVWHAYRLINGIGDKTHLR
jgi:GT2 family glycosyltransferase